LWEPLYKVFMDGILMHRSVHCWNYRRYICQLAKISVEEDLEFTTSKIKENFSNYSAWHHRSKIIKLEHNLQEGKLTLKWRDKRVWQADYDISCCPDLITSSSPHTYSYAEYCCRTGTGALRSIYWAEWSVRVVLSFMGTLAAVYRQRYFTGSI